MTEFYGSAFASQYGSAPNWTWVATLEHLSEADMQRGVRLLATRANPFPPNPAEFLELLYPEGEPTDWEHKRLKLFTPDALLERKRTNEETAHGIAFFDNLRAKGVI